MQQTTLFTEQGPDSLAAAIANADPRSHQTSTAVAGFLRGDLTPGQAATWGRMIRQGVYMVSEIGLEKRCAKCADYWPADSEFFCLTKGGAALDPYCKACRLELNMASTPEFFGARGLAAQQAAEAAACQ